MIVNKTLIFIKNLKLNFTRLQLLNLSLFLGHKRTKWTKFYSLFLLGFRKNLLLINLDYILYMINKSLIFFSFLTHRYGNICALSNFVNYNFAGLTQFFLEKNFYSFYDGRYIGGLVSNIFYIRYTKKRYKYDFVSNFLKLRILPSSFLIFDSNKFFSCFLEASYLGLPSVGFLDTDLNFKMCLYPIFSNNESFFIQCYYLIILIFLRKKAVIFRKLKFLKFLLHIYIYLLKYIFYYEVTKFNKRLFVIKFFHKIFKKFKFTFLRNRLFAHKNKVYGPYFVIILLKYSFYARIVFLEKFLKKCRFSKKYLKKIKYLFLNFLKKLDRIYKYDQSWVSNKFFKEPKFVVNSKRLRLIFKARRYYAFKIYLKILKFFMAKQLFLQNFYFLLGLKSIANLAWFIRRNFFIHTLYSFYKNKILLLDNVFYFQKKFRHFTSALRRLGRIKKIQRRIRFYNYKLRNLKYTKLTKDVIEKRLYYYTIKEYKYLNRRKYKEYLRKKRIKKRKLLFKSKQYQFNFRKNNYNKNNNYNNIKYKKFNNIKDVKNNFNEKMNYKKNQEFSNFYERYKQATTKEDPKTYFQETLNLIASQPVRRGVNVSFRGSIDLNQKNVFSKQSNNTNNKVSQVVNKTLKVNLKQKGFLKKVESLKLIKKRKKKKKKVSVDVLLKKARFLIFKRHTTFFRRDNFIYRRKSFFRKKHSKFMRVLNRIAYALKKKKKHTRKIKLLKKKKKKLKRNNKFYYLRNNKKRRFFKYNKYKYRFKNKFKGKFRFRRRRRSRYKFLVFLKFKNKNYIHNYRLLYKSYKTLNLLRNLYKKFFKYKVKLKILKKRLKKNLRKKLLHKRYKKLKKLLALKRKQRLLLLKKKKKFKFTPRLFFKFRHKSLINHKRLRKLRKYTLFNKRHVNWKLFKVKFPFIRFNYSFKIFKYIQPIRIKNYAYKFFKKRFLSLDRNVVLINKIYRLLPPVYRDQVSDLFHSKG